MNQTVNKYYDLERSANAAKNGTHRALIGGFWNELGQLQMDYIRDRGLASNHCLLDIGCGCLRSGIHLVRYLKQGHYFGTDISQDLLDVGYDVELNKSNLQQKMPRENLTCDGEFNVGQFGVTFDRAIALSVFTHLPVDFLKLCLANLADVIKEGGEFYATVFHSPDTHDWNNPLKHSPGMVISHPNQDPYHYTTASLKNCCNGLPWKVELIEEWQHPRAQKMVVFVRI